MVDLNDIESTLLQVFVFERLQGTFPKSRRYFPIVYSAGLRGMPPCKFLEGHSTFIYHVALQEQVWSGKDKRGREVYCNAGEKQAVRKRNGVEEGCTYRGEGANQVTSSEEDKKLKKKGKERSPRAPSRFKKQTLFQNPGLSVTKRSIRRSIQTTTKSFKRRPVSYH